MTRDEIYANSLARYRRILNFLDEGLTVQDIARQENISAERARQILARGVPPKRPGRPSSRSDADLIKSDIRKQVDNMNQSIQGAVQLLPKPTISMQHEPAEVMLESITQVTNTMHVSSIVVPGRVAFATMQPDDMRHLFFVSTYEVADPDSGAPQQHGYQREPMEPRLPGIARYFQSAENEFLITPIIVSVRLWDDQEIGEFIDLFNQGEIEAIHRRWHRAVVSVVDGQHRFLGLIRAHENDPLFNPTVPVMLYFGLKYKDEANLFDVINSTQRKLPKALIEVTKGDITEANVVSYDQMIRNITFALARDKDSVWYEEVNMTGARDPDRAVTYEGLRRSTSNMFTKEIAARLRAKDLALEKIAKDFWRMVKESCLEAWEERDRERLDPQTREIIEVPVDYRLRELVGVASIAKLGKDILASSLEAQHFNERMSDLVSLLSEVDWAKVEGNPWMASQAGFAGQKELYTMLHNLVYLGQKPGEEA